MSYQDEVIRKNFRILFDIKGQFTEKYIQSALDSARIMMMYRISAKPVCEEEIDIYKFKNYYQGKCPMCAKYISNFEKYCPNCGQKIGWSKGQPIEKEEGEDEE